MVPIYMFSLRCIKENQKIKINVSEICINEKNPKMRTTSLNFKRIDNLTK